MSQKVKNEAQAMMEDHERRMEALAERYIGKVNLEHGRKMSDLFHKKMWYIRRIFNLGQSAGVFKAACQRCKRTNTPTYKKYKKIVDDVEAVMEHLALELVRVK